MSTTGLDVLNRTLRGGLRPKDGRQQISHLAFRLDENTFRRVEQTPPRLSNCRMRDAVKESRQRLLQRTKPL